MLAPTPIAAIGHLSRSQGNGVSTIPQIFSSKHTSRHVGAPLGHGLADLSLQLNSISLCKNILKALAASRTDMPDIELFPKSHLVTFRYYVGVIHFLEEDYAKVRAGYLLNLALG